MTEQEIVDYEDKYPRVFYYGVFCMIDEAKSRFIIEEHLDNDEAWEDGILLYGEFLSSKYNSDNYSEIDCISYFLDNKM